MSDPQQPVLDMNGWEKTWPGGYRENPVVYKEKIGITIDEVVKYALEPFAKSGGTALEIGCGGGFWVEKHLLPRFARVIGLDVIRRDWAMTEKMDNRFTYHQVPVGDYSCRGVADSSVDFVWSFGCFCHLPLAGIEEYVKSSFRVLRPGGNSVMSFSECGRRPGGTPVEKERVDVPNWALNDLDNTKRILAQAGFVNFSDLFPNSKDLIVSVHKHPNV